MSPLGPFTRWVFVILLAVGAPFLLLGLSEGWQAYTALRHGRQTTGTVIRNSYSVTQEGATESGAYYPVVQFTDAEAQPHTFTDGVGALPADYAVGASVPVLYDPAGVAPPRLATFKRLWFVPALFTVIGLLPVTVFSAWLGLAALQARRAHSSPVAIA
jgi:hypothetical protein